MLAARHAPPRPPMPARARHRGRRARHRRMRRAGHPAREVRPGLRGRGDLPAALLGLPHAHAAGTQGSADKPNGREYKDGPNFNARKEDEGPGPLRDPQRRLLLRPDAAGHRRRRARPRRSPSSSRSTPAGTRPAASLRPCSTSRRSATIRSPCAPRSRAAATGPTRGSTACSSSTSRRRELLPEVEGLKAQQNAASQAIAAAKKAGEDAAGAIAEMQEVARRGKALREELDGVQAELDEALALAARTRPTRRAADEDTVLYERGESGRAGKDHLELAGAWIDMEAGARVAGSRFAYLKGDLVLLELALVRWALELLARQGLRAGDPAGARARGGAVRHRLPARHRAADLPAGRRRRCTSPARARCALASLHAGEIARRRAAAAALRRLLALLPARGRARPGATRAGCSASTSSTRSRCSRSSSRRTRADEHERLLANEEEILERARDPVPRGQHRASPTSAPRRRRSTTARPGCPASSASAS